MNEITENNLDHAIRLIKVALADGNVVPIVGVRCTICGAGAELRDVRKFVKGAVPLPNPFPEGTLVVDTRWGTAGVVTRSEVICLSGMHRHRRIVEVQPDDRSGKNMYNTEEDRDGTTYLVRKEEWEALQQSAKVAQEN